MNTIQAETFLRLPGIEISHYGFVNQWECDENQHWNVQFYSRAFQQSAEAAAVRSTHQNPGLACAATRHIRYYRELLAAQSIAVATARINDGPYAGRVAHMMFDSQSGVLAATALDTPQYDAHALPGVAADHVSQAMPRGLSAEPIPSEDCEMLIQSGRAVVTNIRVVRPYELDHNGDLLADEIVSRITDGAPHAWHHLGVTTDWLQARKLGRVAVEMKLTHLGGVRAGDVVKVVSWGDNADRRTFGLRHQLEIIGSGMAVAACEVRCLVLDHQTRRAAELPDIIRQKLG